MTDVMIHWSGAILGLALGIFLILKKVNPVYALFSGAIIGGMIGGANLDQTVKIIIEGTKTVMPAVVRVLASGVLAGILIESGAAEKIAETIVEKLGDKKALLAIALSTMIITAAGVFITVSIIIVAPIALSVAKKVGVSKSSILLAIAGGGKAGNIISPNPNTIAAAKGFEVELAEVMLRGFIPALIGLMVTYIVAKAISKRGEFVKDTDIPAAVTTVKPSFMRAMVAPLAAVILLSINPLGNILKVNYLADIRIDSMIILPVSGLLGLIAMGQIKKVIPYTTSGLNKMTGVATILIAAGSIAGIISKSNLSEAIVQAIEMSGIAGTYLAPISGVLMAGATASTSTGVIVSAGAFGQAILTMGTAPLNAAVMVHTGATVIDHLPHGNVFLVSAESAKMNMGERLKLIPYETLIGAVMAITATIMYGFIG
jgi:gluconate:H+ symporter, GntP family